MPLIPSSSYVELFAADLDIDLDLDLLELSSVPGSEGMILMPSLSTSFFFRTGLIRIPSSPLSDLTRRDSLAVFWLEPREPASLRTSLSVSAPSDRALLASRDLDDR